MRKQLCVERKREVLSLIPNVSFSNVPCWYDASRRDLKMDLIVPKNRTGHPACPAVVWICGGAYRVVNRSVWLPEMMRIARAGYVVAGIEYRTGNEAVFPAQLIDVKAAVRFLRAHAKAFCVDPNRIYAMGESAGGTMASLLGVTGDRKEFDLGDHLDQSSAVQGVVDYYGVVDLSGASAEQDRMDAAVNPNNDVHYFAFEEFLGVGYQKAEAEKASAVRYISEQTPPFMILHGTKDAVVPMAQSQRLYDALQKNGIPCEFMVIEEAAHGDDLFYQDEVTDDVIRFLNSIPMGKE
ncbi:MAG: alpha/beta hydrolase [Clostridia bacterium]|nr:alpha/beta hydrolase [Clostridia bacterium]